MQILQVVLNLSRNSTGVAVTVRNFFDAMLALGHKPLTVSFDSSTQDAEHRPAGTVSIPTVPIHGMKRYCFSPQAFLGSYDQVVKRSDLLLIHNLYAHHFTWAARLAMKFDKPCLVVPHGALTDFCLSRNTIAKKIWIASMRKFITQRAGLICSSGYELRQALHYVRPASTHVFYWPAQPVPDTRIGSNVEERDRPTILLAGRLHPMKRTLQTVRAFRSVHRAGARLYVAGPPSKEVSVRDLKQAAGADWGTSVIYLGELARSEMQDWYRRADGTVIFSKGDNFSHAAAEAMLAGCPVFVSQDVGLGSLIEEQDCGSAFSIESDIDIERALVQVLDRAATRSRLSGAKVESVSAALSEASFRINVSRAFMSACASVNLSASQGRLGIAETRLAESTPSRHRRL